MAASIPPHLQQAMLARLASANSPAPPALADFLKLTQDERSRPEQTPKLVGVLQGAPKRSPRGGSDPLTRFFVQPSRKATTQSPKSVADSSQPSYLSLRHSLIGRTTSRIRCSLPSAPCSSLSGVVLQERKSWGGQTDYECCRD